MLLESSNELMSDSSTITLMRIEGDAVFKFNESLLRGQNPEPSAPGCGPRRSRLSGRTRRVAKKESADPRWARATSLRGRTRWVSHVSVLGNPAVVG
jgi:hypothetical protein